MVKNKIYHALMVTVFVIILTYGAFADINYLTNNIQKNYSSGEIIKGPVNLRINNQSVNSTLTSNFLGSMNLLDFIKNQSNLVEGENYNCTTRGCMSSYGSRSTLNQLQVSSSSSYFIGFAINGPGAEVTSGQIRVTSNAEASCSPNIYVDFLADGRDVLTSSQSSGESCGVKRRGCYDQTNNLEASISAGTEYCEKISIPPTPGFILGGNIRRGTGNSNLTMKLYNTEADLLGSCRLPQSTQSIEELSCSINYSSQEVKDYYVCITTNQSNGYKIGWETSGTNCGTAQGFGSLTSDFDLFADTMKYSASPNFMINHTTYELAFGNSLEDEINDYIDDYYGGECQLSSCFIPIKIYGNDQALSFGESKMSYQSVGVPSETQQIHLLDYEPSRITANNISLQIDKANFTIPIETNQNKFKLYIDGSLLFEQNINIKKSFTFDVNPKFVAFGQNAKFSATSANSNITNTVWNFGDGTNVERSNSSSVYHAFTKNGTYFDINVTATSNQTQVTKQFRIYVGNPKDVANVTIQDYKKRIANITSKINTYPAWLIPKIQNAVKLNNISAGINLIETSYKNATTDQDYQDVMLDLLSLNIPYYVSSTLSLDNIPLSTGYESINTNYIEQIENKDIADDTTLRSQIVGWMNDNFNPEISYSKIEKIYDSDKETIGTIFTIRTNPLSTINEDTYLVFGQDIEHSGVYKLDYKVKSITSGIDYVKLDTSKSEVFEFFVEGDIDGQLLGAYISPSLDTLGNVEAPTGYCEINNICESGETAQSCPEDCSKKWFKFTLFGWVILIVSAFIAYIILQEWYKRHYQNSLFPEANDLYNLINFIYNARKSGLSDSEIRSALKQQKWTNEQIRFALRKIDGKRVGMLEIPIFTWKENKKTIAEIVKRQTEGAKGVRFIKRPY